MPKILVVEDNELNMKLFRDLLGLINCDVLGTMTGTDALELCRNHSPDLILMDIQLDGISGIDLIKDIKSDKKMQNIPIIAITAYAMKNEEAKILQSGCDKYLSKPVSIEVFLSAVKEHLSINTK
ncbi:MAG: response regulator [Rickettsiaceae bacterium]|nr:response regulator [Rickettsiaceae bacterium]